MYRCIKILAKLHTKPCESVPVVGLSPEAILLSITAFVVPQRLDQGCDDHASVSSSLVYNLTISTVSLWLRLFLNAAYGTSMTRDNKWILRKGDD